MGFFDDFAKGFVTGVKDVGTSATRIVTDTAIDIGDVATGFQFSEEMDAAKKKMSEAGVLSAAEAIEKNHYGFLKDMEREAKEKVERVSELYKTGQQVERDRDKKADQLADMLAQADQLAQKSKDALALLAAAREIPDWQKWATILDIPQQELVQVEATVAKWNEIGQRISISSLSTSVASGVTGAISGLSTLAKAGSALKASKVTSAISKGSKFAKIGKLAGRSSAVLAVVTVGLDIGLSVAQLEAKKDTLEDNLEQLNDGIAEANRDITALRREMRAIQLRIDELLGSVEPRQTELSWDGWIEETTARLDAVRSRLVNPTAIIARAIEAAKDTRDLDYKSRLNLVTSVDLEISTEEARQIIADVDAGKYDQSFAHLSPVATGLKRLSWQVDGPGETEIIKLDANDALTCKYSLSGESVWTRQTWTYYATAPQTTTLAFTWNYSGFHAWFKPFVQVSVFVDSAEGRRYQTLLEGSQRKGQGSEVIEIEQGQSFGFIIKGSNYDRDSRLLGELAIAFNR